MKNFIIGMLIALGLTGFVIGSGCNYSNVETIKANATNTWTAAGFKVIGYEGYQLGGLQTPGGKVWYIVQKGSVTYDGFISKWKGEYHIYNLHALDAIKGE